MSLSASRPVDRVHWNLAPNRRHTKRSWRIYRILVPSPPPPNRIPCFQFLDTSSGSPALAQLQWCLICVTMPVATTKRLESHARWRRQTARRCDKPPLTASATRNVLRPGLQGSAASQLRQRLMWEDKMRRLSGIAALSLLAALGGDRARRRRQRRRASSSLGSPIRISAIAGARNSSARSKPKLSLRAWFPRSSWPIAKPGLPSRSRTCAR